MEREALYAATIEGIDESIGEKTSFHTTFQSDSMFSNHYRGNEAIKQTLKGRS